jgi:nitrite reductase/ring-hydroxylating ferredoxin subunit
MQSLCALEDLRPGAAKEASVEGVDGPRHLVLLLAGGLVRAYLNACPHQGRNLAYAPDEFLFDPRGRLVCPHHGACFDVDSGACVDGPCKGAFLTPVDITLKDGFVFLVEKQKGEKGEGRR